MPIFPTEAEQHQYAQIPLNRFLNEGYDKRNDWEVRGTIRKDVLERARSGIKVKKMVMMRRTNPKLRISVKQVYEALAALNHYNPRNKFSFAMLKAIDELSNEKGFCSAEVAVKAFGPSKKDYQKGDKQQSVKKKLRRLREIRLLRFERRKYFKLPVWSLLYEEVKKIEKNFSNSDIMQL